VGHSEDAVKIISSTRERLFAAFRPRIANWQRAIAARVTGQVSEWDECTNRVGYAVRCDSDGAISRENHVLGKFTLEVVNGTTLTLTCFFEGSGGAATVLPKARTVLKTETDSRYAPRAGCSAPVENLSALLGQDVVAALWLYREWRGTEHAPSYSHAEGPKIVFPIDSDGTGLAGFESGELGGLWLRL
jgi:hypothetical protein